jgi:hypothetical protein
MDTDEVNAFESVINQPLARKPFEYLISALDDIVSQPIVFFAKTSDPIALSQAVDYIRRNELTKTLIVVHIVNDKTLLRLQNDVTNLPNEEYLSHYYEGSDFVTSTALAAVPDDVVQLVQNCAILDSFYS